jgi:hypothetical protein
LGFHARSVHVREVGRYPESGSTNAAKPNHPFGWIETQDYKKNKRETI